MRKMEMLMAGSSSLGATVGDTSLLSSVVVMFK